MNYLLCEIEFFYFSSYSLQFSQFFLQDLHPRQLPFIESRPPSIKFKLTRQPQRKFCSPFIENLRWAYKTAGVLWAL